MQTKVLNNQPLEICCMCNYPLGFSLLPESLSRRSTNILDAILIFCESFQSLKMFWLKVAANGEVQRNFSCHFAQNMIKKKTVQHRSVKQALAFEQCTMICLLPNFLIIFFSLWLFLIKNLKIIQLWCTSGYCFEAIFFPLLKILSTSKEKT